MTDAYDSFQNKVEVIFTELAGPSRSKWLTPGVPSRCLDQIAKAVASESRFPEEDAWNIAFNLTDWQADAAFLVALHLFPERFTDEEVDEAVRSLLIHVPAHVVAAARLAGYSAEDIFAEPEGRPEPDAPSNGGPAEQLGSSDVRGGPPPSS